MATTVSTTFRIQGMPEVGKKSLRRWPTMEWVRDHLGNSVEACSHYTGELSYCAMDHVLMGAVAKAFDRHFPLTLSPDMMWFTILQGLGHHIEQHAEALRHHFVRHQGTLALGTRRDDFVKGSPENAWESVFGDFSAQLLEHLGSETHSLIVASFSTTGPVERVASEIALLSAMAPYFTYDLMTLCGIPEITLEGTLDDWTLLRERVRQLAKWDLDWWTERIVPHLDQFVRACQGDVDHAFWSSIFRGGSRSGAPDEIDGWLHHFLPYLRTGRNPFRAVTGEELPPSYAVAPFKWQVNQAVYPMEFVSGFIGLEQNPATNGLRPVLGWAVRGQAPP